MKKQDYLTTINYLLKESDDPQLLDFIYALLLKCNNMNRNSIAILLEKNNSNKHAAIKEFNKWKDKYKASYEKSKCPSAYQLNTGDLQIMYDYISATGISEGLFDIVSSTYNYGFRRGCNYINNQK